MRKRRVFIYDDDKGILSLLTYFFTLREYDVIARQQPAVCPLGPEACVCSSPHACADVIITDFMMPEMNGIDLLLSQFHKGCKIPMSNKALISGFVEEQELNRVQELGCAFFNKPFDLDDLSVWLDKREQEMDLSQPLGILGKSSPESAEHPTGNAMNAAA